MGDHSEYRAALSSREEDEGLLVGHHGREEGRRVWEKGHRSSAADCHNMSRNGLARRHLQEFS
jgi:hypothetical protein